MFSFYTTFFRLYTHMQTHKIMARDSQKEIEISQFDLSRSVFENQFLGARNILRSRK